MPDRRLPGEAPTPEATESLVRVLAWLAVRYGVDPAPGATTSFTSRGSNRWPAGSVIETTTIAGHREMSRTACPGDAAFALVKGELPARVTARLGATTSPTTTTTTTTTPPTTTPPTTTTTTAPPPTAASPTTGAGTAAARGSDGGSGLPLLPVAGVGGAFAAAIGAVIVRRNRLARGD